MEYREVTKRIEGYRKDLEKAIEERNIDPALFWAGKMSQYITMMQNINIVNLSDNAQMLFAVRDEYDSVILGRVK